MSDFDKQTFLTKLKTEYTFVVGIVYFSLIDNGFTHQQAIRQMMKRPELVIGPVGLPAHAGPKVFKKKAVLDF